MNLDVKFSENDQSFAAEFGEVHSISDGGYERGYAEGYDAGNTEGYAEGRAEGNTALSSVLSRSVEELIIPEGVTEIGTWGCAYCKNLKKVSFPETLENLGGNAFAFCTSEEFNSVTLPASLKTVLSGVFRNCTYLKTVKFLGTPESIASGIFSNCVYLGDVYVPWAEGEVENSPWGAAAASIHYNHTEG